MRNNMKTLVLMAVLGALFVGVGQLLGGTNGAIMALVIAGLLNFAMYFWSAKIALASARAKPVTESGCPSVLIVRSLTQRGNMPMPTSTSSSPTSPTPLPPVAANHAAVACPGESCG
jgi:heat shock protein HtpX